MKSWTAMVICISLFAGLGGAEAANAPLTTPVSLSDPTDVSPVFITSSEEVACEPTPTRASSAPTAPRAAPARRPAVRRPAAQRPAARPVAKAQPARPRPAAQAPRVRTAQAPRARQAVRPQRAQPVRQLAAVTPPTPAVERCFVYRRDRLTRASLPLAPMEFVKRPDAILYQPDLPVFAAVSSPGAPSEPLSDTEDFCERIRQAGVLGVPLSPEDEAAAGGCSQGGGGGGAGGPGGGAGGGGGGPGGGTGGSGGGGGGPDVAGPGPGPGPGDTGGPIGGGPGDGGGGEVTPPVVAAAPEPSTWSLMIVGVGLAGLALRRRRARELAFQRAV